jgi:hypothetical protein
MVIGAPLAAQPSTRPEGARGYSAAERRVIDQEMDRLARVSTIQRGIIARIAEVLEAEYPGLAAGDLIGRLEDQVKLATQLTARVDTLETEVANLRGAALDRAKGLLADARSAFNEGNFIASEAKFGELVDFLGQRGESDAGLLHESALARALSAELTGTDAGFERAHTYRLDARRYERELRRNSLRREWDICHDQLASDLTRVRTFGRGQILPRSEQFAEDCADQLDDRDTDRHIAGLLQSFIAQILAERVQAANGDEVGPLEAKAAAAYEKALALLDAERYPVERAKVLRWSANMLIQKAFRSELADAVILLDLADRQYQEAVVLNLQRDQRIEASLAQSDAAVAWHVRSRFLAGDQRLAALRTFIDQSKAALALVGQDAAPKFRANMHGNLCTGNLDLVNLGMPQAWDRATIAEHLKTAQDECQAGLALQDAEAYPLPHASLQIISSQVSLVTAKFDPAQCQAQRSQADAAARIALQAFEGFGHMANYADYARSVIAAIDALQCPLASDS